AALSATFTVAILILLVWLSARTLNKIDGRRALDAAALRRSQSDLQAANARLVESDERFRMFMEHMPAAAFLKDEQGRYVWGNRAWREQFPTSAGEPTGRTDNDLWPPDVRDVFQASDRKTLQQ